MCTRVRPQMRGELGRGCVRVSQQPRGGEARLPSIHHESVGYFTLAASARPLTCSAPFSPPGRQGLNAFHTIPSSAGSMAPASLPFADPGIPKVPYDALCRRW